MCTEGKRDCLFCGQELRVDIQTYPAKYNMPDLILVTCKNPECAIVRAGHETLSLDEHTRMYQESGNTLINRTHKNV